MIFVVGSTFGTYQMQREQFQFMARQQQNLPFDMAQFGAVIGVVSVVFGVVWGWALPVFTLIWFNRQKTRADVAT